ncbi:type II toxin-antitoxin system VapC family toxin [Sphingobium sp. Z007]|uniref:type II toxin-antitoxin system VapC family toxin n=1 Tax=Sphingobium sp. Z007 TaxID=627495 RepID=UPI000B49DCA9|nr:type II toxin-antitoxin system VapC family toxin [Sphingobium sp. Z007]
MIVLDSSALLALLLDERGGEVVLPVARNAVMSSVNLSEVIERGVANEHSADGLTLQIERFGVSINAFDRDQAIAAANLRPLTRHRGLSLGDRACLALAQTLNVPVLTADRLWADLDIGVDIRLIR